MSGLRYYRQTTTTRGALAAHAPRVNNVIVVIVITVHVHLRSLIELVMQRSLIEFVMQRSLIELVADRNSLLVATSKVEYSKIYISVCLLRESIMCS